MMNVHLSIHHATAMIVTDRVETLSNGDRYVVRKIHFDTTDGQAEVTIFLEDGSELSDSLIESLSPSLIEGAEVAA
jgi:hypothetical protein